MSGETRPHAGGMCGVNEARCLDCEQELKLRAIAARARGDSAAERKALDTLALVERGQLRLRERADLHGQDAHERRQAVSDELDELVLDLAADWTIAVLSAVLGVGSWDEVDRAVMRIGQSVPAALSGAEHELAYYGDAAAK